MGAHRRQWNQAVADQQPRYLGWKQAVLADVELHPLASASAASLAAACLEFEQMQQHWKQAVQQHWKQAVQQHWKQAWVADVEPRPVACVPPVVAF